MLRLCWLLQVVWVPGEDAWLAVVTGHAMHVYNLAQAAHTPLLTLAAPEGSPIAGATFCMAGSQVSIA